MRRIFISILVMIMLIACCGCFVSVDRGEHEDHDRGGFEEHRGRY